MQYHSSSSQALICLLSQLNETSCASLFTFALKASFLIVISASGKQARSDNVNCKCFLEPMSLFLCHKLTCVNSLHRKFECNRHWSPKGVGSQTSLIALTIQDIQFYQKSNYSRQIYPRDSKIQTQTSQSPKMIRTLMSYILLFRSVSQTCPRIKFQSNKLN